MLPEFCPTETNGEIKRDELDVWIKQFNEADCLLFLRLDKINICLAKLSGK